MSITPNPYVESLEAYEITPQEPWQIHEDVDLHKLDWNEGAYMPEFARRVARRRLIRDEYFNWYPDCAAIALTKALAEWLRVSAFNVLTFPGSDVALETLCRTYLSPGDRVLIPTPTYENFFPFAAACGAQLQFVTLPKPYAFDAAALIRDLPRPPKMVYLVSPNNPCGYAVAREDVRAICAAFPQSLIILDQAYVELAEVIATREWLSGQMARLELQFYPSSANFILFEVPDPTYFMAEFKRHGVYVRDKSRAAPGCLRVTVSTRTSAQHFCEVLARLLDV